MERTVFWVNQPVARQGCRAQAAPASTRHLPGTQRTVGHDLETLSQGVALKGYVQPSFSHLCLKAQNAASPHSPLSVCMWYVRCIYGYTCNFPTYMHNV